MLALMIFAALHLGTASNVTFMGQKKEGIHIMTEKEEQKFPQLRKIVGTEDSELPLSFYAKYRHRDQSRPYVPETIAETMVAVFICSNGKYWRFQNNGADVSCVAEENSLSYTSFFNVMHTGEYLSGDGKVSAVTRGKEWHFMQALNDKILAVEQGDGRLTNTRGHVVTWERFYFRPVDQFITLYDADGNENPDADERDEPYVAQMYSNENAEYDWVTIVSWHGYYLCRESNDQIKQSSIRAPMGGISHLKCPKGDVCFQTEDQCPLRHIAKECMFRSYRKKLQR